ncbi:MAG: atpH [Francisellaceae bacterium]|nr:atpH [Francisellaceae bacterium]
MIGREVLARPYAKAIFELAEKSGQLNEWSFILSKFSSIVSDPLLKEVLKNPFVSTNQVRELLYKLIKLPLNDLMKNFIALIAKNKRVEILPQIFAVYESYKDNKLKKLKVEITSAYTLENEIQMNIKDKLGKEYQAEIEVEWIVDPTIIGGFIIRLNNQVLDGSLKGKLATIQQSLTENP